MVKKIIYAFLHIPKTAGTIIASSLKKKYSPSQILVADSKFADLPNRTESYQDLIDKVSALSPVQKRQIKIICGHGVYYGIHRHFPEAEVKYFTIIREPLDRLVSHYNYYLTLLKNNSFPGRRQEKYTKECLLSSHGTLSLQEALSTRSNFSNYTFKFLADHFFGTDCADLFDETYTNQGEISRLLGEIKKILSEFNFIAITEKSLSDFAYLSFLLKFKLPLRQINRSEKFLTSEEINAAKNLLSDRLALDYDLYNFCLELNGSFKKKNKYFYLYSSIVRSSNMVRKLPLLLFQLSAKLKRFKVYQQLISWLKK